MMNSNPSENSPEIISISSKKFLLFSLVLAIAIFLLGQIIEFPKALVAAQVLLTVMGLFVFGSIRYRIDKNAITYGAVMVIFATFWTVWWPTSSLREKFSSEGFSAFNPALKHYLLTFHGWDELVHADTMLFILGLTLFVACIAQTRLLESVSFAVLKKNKGRVVITIGILAAMVSFFSGILDGVSMIGLMIRILVLLLFLAKVRDEALIYAVMVSTVVTTVCGMWLAYGEPPNLIMKANLSPHLDNSFFLRYCMPVAVLSFFIVFFNIRKKMKGAKVDIKNLDILDLHTADVRFLQAERHGQVMLAAEFVDNYKDLLGDQYSAIEKRLHEGEPLGTAMIREKVPVEIRQKLLGLYFSEELAEDLDLHFQHEETGMDELKDHSYLRIKNTIHALSKQRIRTQWIGTIAFIPFIALLVWHAIDHDVPLFFASFAGSLVAFAGIVSFPKIRQLALYNARHEYTEYLFLFPLFFSITLLQKTGFFTQIAQLLEGGIHHLGVSVMAYLQFVGTTFLSAILDNNVVADFASRALHGLELGTLRLFSMAQIAGYATGGCWTHIGSAQSVVAYAFIRREINPNFTPFGWIKAMTPIILEIFVLMTVVVYGEALLMQFLP